MAEILTFVFSFLIFYGLFKWLGVTENRRRHYRYADNGTWIALWAVAFSISDWSSAGTAEAGTFEDGDAGSGDGGGGDGGAGCGGCGG